jgi:methyl-accepting chemotaxis protein
MTTVAPRFDAASTMDALSRRASDLGREAAEVRGALDDTRQAGTRQAQAMGELSTQVQDVQRAQDQIDAETRTSLQAVSRAREAVEAVGEEVAGIVESLQQVSQAAAQITQIALQTRLVAFNASVEASRAGEAGRGFAVVADAVKDLAARVETSSKDITGTVKRLDARIGVLAREIRRRDRSVAGSKGGSGAGSGAGSGSDAGSDASQGAVHAALAEVEADVSRIHEAAARSQAVCENLARRMSEMGRQASDVADVLDTTFGRTETFLAIAESLVETVADAGLETPDTPYIAAAQEAARAIAEQLEGALQRGELTLEDAFDERYVDVDGSDPAQHLTRFCAVADRLFPAVQETTLSPASGLTGVVFCVATDRNGYIACHNRRYNHPQRRGDPVWNAAHSRHRRIFNDRAGLAAGRNTRPFLLQTYRRDMGGGVKVVLKEVDAPIIVAGRHWGGLRLAWTF